MSIKDAAAVLTPAQREFILGERELEGASARNMRSRIRKRVAASVDDYALLLDHLDRGDAENALEDAPTDDAIAFLIRNAIPSPDRERTQSGASDADLVEFAEYVLENAVNRAAESEGHPRRYDVNISPRETDKRSAADLELSIRRGNMTRDGLDRLHEQGAIFTDTYEEVVARLDLAGNDGGGGFAGNDADDTDPREADTDATDSAVTERGGSDGPDGGETAGGDGVEELAERDENGMTRGERKMRESQREYRQDDANTETDGDS